MRSRPQWDQNAGTWETPIDWGNILSMVAAGTLTAGAADMIMAGGTAAGAGGGGGVSAGAGGVLPNSGGYVAGVSAPQIASQGVSAGIPLGGITAAGAGAAGGAGASGAAGAAGQSLGRKLINQVLTPQGLATLAGTIGGLATSGGGIDDDPNAKALIEMALRRQQRTDPLHESVTRLANAMLPTAYQSGRT